MGTPVTDPDLKERLLEKVRNRQRVTDPELIERLTGKRGTATRRPPRPNTMRDIGFSAAGGAEKEVADILGLPVDAVAGGVNYLAEKMGAAPPVQHPVLGSGHLREMFTKAGGVPEYQPQTLEGRVAHKAGEFAGASMIPAAGLAAKARTATMTPLTTGFMTPMISGAQRAPGTVAGLDIMGGGTAGGAGAMAEEFTPDMVVGEGEWYETNLKDPVVMLAEVTSSAALPLAWQLTPRFAKDQLTSFTRFGQKRALQGALQRTTGGQPTADAIKRAPRGYGLSSGEAARNETLLGMEATAERTNFQNFAVRAAERRAMRDKIIRQEIDDIFGAGTDPHTLQKNVAQRVMAIEKAMQKGVQDAADEAMRNISLLPKGGDRASQSAQARSSLGKARAAWKTKERGAWAAVDKSPPRDTSEISDVYQRLMDIPDFRQEMPAYVTETMRTWGKRNTPITVGDIQAFRSKVLEIGRQTDTPRIDAIANALQKVSLKTMADGADGALETAIGVSKAFADNFYRGPVGRLFKTTFTGEPRVRQGLELKTLLKGDTEVTAQNVKAIRKAAVLDGDNVAGPDLDAAMEGYVTDRFMREGELVTDMGLNPRAAQKWMSKYKELLDQFPFLRARLRDAVSTSAKAKRKEAIFKTRTKLIEGSAAYRYTRKDPHVTANEFWESSDPAEYITKLTRLARKDRSGKAIKGLRTSIKEALIQKLGSGNVRTAEGDVLLKGGALAKYMDDPRYREALGLLLDDKEALKRIDVLADALHRMGIGRPAGVALPEAPNLLIRNIANVFGARKGGELGGNVGGSLQTAQKGSRFAGDLASRFTSRHFNQLLADALEDPVLMHEFQTIDVSKLLQNPSKVPTGRLHAWLLAVAEDNLDEE